MQELANELQKLTKDLESMHSKEDLDQLPPEAQAMQKAAEQWAVAALRTYEKEVLDAALNISKAITRYLDEMYREKEIKVGIRSLEPKNES